MYLKINRNPDVPLQEKCKDVETRYNCDVGTIFIIHDIISTFTKIYYSGISVGLLKRLAENFWCIIKEKGLSEMLPTELSKELTLRIHKGNLTADLFNGVLAMITSDLASMVKDPKPQRPPSTDMLPIKALLTTRSGGKENSFKKTKKRDKLIKVKSTSHIEIPPNKTDKKRSLKFFSKKIMIRAQSTNDIKTLYLSSSYPDKESPRKVDKKKLKMGNILSRVTMPADEEIPTAILRSKSEGEFTTDPFMLKSDILADKIITNLKGELDGYYFSKKNHRSQEKITSPAISPPVRPPVYSPLPVLSPSEMTGNAQPDKGNDVVEYSELADYLIRLRSKAQELGIWEPPLASVESSSTLMPFNDITNNPIEFMANDSSSCITEELAHLALVDQWVIVRRLLTQKGGVKLKVPDTIPELLQLAGQALKIEPCKVRNINSQAEIISLDQLCPSVVFITTEEEELSYFSTI